MNYYCSKILNKWDGLVRFAYVLQPHGVVKDGWLNI